MKPLTPKQIEAFVRMVGLTRDREFDCGECLRHVGEFAEQQLAGLPLSEALTCVEHHLSVCAECREEYQALIKILSANK
ncbi:MAG: hypothetical protein L0Z50_00430 [Verrucomicrobiales bacterium]|nr:hypothetical protein [Verrucomicrobiales bacterium]